MSVKKKSNIYDNSEKCVTITDSDSVDPSDNDGDGSDIVFSIMFHCFKKYHAFERRVISKHY